MTKFIANNLQDFLRIWEKLAIKELTLVWKLTFVEMSFWKSNLGLRFDILAFQFSSSFYCTMKVSLTLFILCTLHFFLVISRLRIFFKLCVLYIGVIFLFVHTFFFSRYRLGFRILRVNYWFSVCAISKSNTNRGHLDPKYEHQRKKYHLAKFPA